MKPDTNDELILEYLAQRFVRGEPSYLVDIAKSLAMRLLPTTRSLAKLRRWGWVLRTSGYWVCWVITPKGAEAMLQAKNSEVFLTALDIWDDLKGYK